MRFADADGRAKVRRLYKYRIVKRRLDLCNGLARRAFPLRSQQRHIFHNWQPCIGKKALHHIFVHPRRGAQHARADIRNPRQLEESLDGSVLAKSPVQYRKNHIQRLPAQRLVAIQSRNAAASQRRRSRFRRQQCGLPFGQHARSGVAAGSPARSFF